MTRLGVTFGWSQFLILVQFVTTCLVAVHFPSVLTSYLFVSAIRHMTTLFDFLSNKHTSCCTAICNFVLAWDSVVED